MNKTFQNQQKSATISELDEGEPLQRIVIIPNCSMSSRQAAIVVCTFAIVLLSISGFFYSYGLWLVIPFAGLDLIALSLALYVSLRRNYRYQVVEVNCGEIRVLCGNARGETECRFQTYWSQVCLELSQGGYPSKLWISAKGEKIELGCWLTDVERCQLAQRLKNIVCI